MDDGPITLRLAHTCNVNRFLPVDAHIKLYPLRTLSHFWVLVYQAIANPYATKCSFLVISSC